VALVEHVLQLRGASLSAAQQARCVVACGESVRLRTLASLLGTADASGVAAATPRGAPVLVLRLAGRRLAVHVDEVLGNQEVVVKDVGPQLARLPGIAGATVMGAGGIVLILNPFELDARLAAANNAVGGAVEGSLTGLSEGPVAAPPAGPSASTFAGAGGGALQGAVDGADLGTAALAALAMTESGGIIDATVAAPATTRGTVMVVDDSLTVRRVTQRLLMRAGFAVRLAKDGVDALEQLQETVPDIMLVDIEMPRMDGFDLVRNVRNEARLRHVPVIMITSRTAEKHRHYARDLGVDLYLGKPYEERQLLDAIGNLTGARRPRDGAGTAG